MSFTEKKTGGRRIYSGKILGLDLDEVVLPDGKSAKREIVRHSGGAAALVVVGGCVLLVKQFRYAYCEETYEIPAGKIGQGEDPAVAAVRELEEETGYTGTPVPFLTIYPSPGYTDEVITVCAVENAVKRESHPDEGEFVESFLTPLDEAAEMIENGKIRDGKTVAAIYKYLYLKECGKRS